MLRTTDYDFKREEVLYSFMQDDSTACKVVGYDWYIDGCNNINAKIADKISHKGKTYRVRDIADSAFMNAKHLCSVYIPHGVERIGMRAFSGCNLPLINMPSSVTEIGAFSISENKQLRAILLSSSLKTIPTAALSDNPRLKSITIPEGVVSLELDALACCDSLTDVSLPSTLRHIARGVFFECFQLKTIVIPANVSEIGEYAFWRCKSLTDVYVYASEPPVVTRIFNTPGITVHVPAASVSKYKQAYQWKDLHIVAMP